MSNVINIRRFVDVSTGVVTAPATGVREWGAILFVQKGSDDSATELKSYTELAALVADGSNTEAVKAATVFYGTGYQGYVPNTTFWVAKIGAKDTDQFSKNFTALMSNEAFYWVIMDSNFDVETRKTAATICEASQSSASHKLVIEDYSADAANKSLEDDTDSLIAYCAKNKFTSVATTWVNPSNEQKYYGAAMCSYFATRRFNASARQLASIAHKAASGIQPVDLEDSAVEVEPTAAYDNLASKCANVYANIKIVGLPAWENGNIAAGDDISDHVAADFLNHTITMSVFNALQITPRIPMNSDGAVILASAIEQGFSQLSAAGIISGGVSLDGETFPNTGYKISIPVPTGVDKANGIWRDIDCRALLSGSAKKVIIGNILKR